ncbi:unnamed protein product [Sphagnum tenellum]
MATLDDALAAIQNLQTQATALQARADQLENQRLAAVVTNTDLRNQITGLQGMLAPLQAAHAAAQLAQGAALPAQVQVVAGGGRRVLPRITFNNDEKEDWLSFK